MMERYFNVAGPCIPGEHYMIEAANRLEDIERLIDGKQYFVIHAARQSGKTTLLLDLTNRLNREGRYYALYCSLEVVQGITDPEKGIPAVIGAIRSALRGSDIKGGINFAKDANYIDFANVLKDELSDFCASLDKPLVVFFDEADCLSEGTLITFLRQLRNGYNTRSLMPFVHSLALTGMRNIRDFKACIRSDSATLGSASPFNIVTKTLTLRNFTRDEIAELYAQHTADTGQLFEEAAIDRAWQQSQGQPWLVNAIARDVIYELLDYDFTRPVTAELVDEAIERIILRRDTHIDSLSERLKEPRIRKVIEPIILGSEQKTDVLSDDFSYVRDLGLIRNDRGPAEPANPIYAEVIIRTLTMNSQEALKSEQYPYSLPRYMCNGKFDMNYLLTDFQQFWRENSAIWTERYDYKEAAPHLVLQAFLQRILNGGGHIVREMAAERGRVDLCVEFEGQKYPIELKLRYGEKAYQDGVEQLARYMDSLGCTRGWLVVFDRREEIVWDDKLFTRTESTGNKTITVVGC